MILEQQHLEGFKEDRATLRLSVVARLYTHHRGTTTELRYGRRTSISNIPLCMPEKSTSHLQGGNVHRYRPSESQQAQQGIIACSKWSSRSQHLRSSGASVSDCASIASLSSLQSSYCDHCCLPLRTCFSRNATSQDYEDYQLLKSATYCYMQASGSSCARTQVPM